MLNRLPTTLHTLTTEAKSCMMGTPVVMAVTGSHSYGLAAPYSDVDVRAVYCIPVTRKLGLSIPSERITTDFNSEGIHVDFVATEFTKFCRELGKGQGAALELVFSHLQLEETEDLATLRSLALPFLRSKPFMMHCRGFAGGQWRHVGTSIPTAKTVTNAFRMALTGYYALVTGTMILDFEFLLHWWMGSETNVTNSSLWGFVEMRCAGIEHDITNPEHLSACEALFHSLMGDYETAESRYMKHPTEADTLALDSFAVERALNEEYHASTVQSS